MSEHDPGWSEYTEYSDFDETTRIEDMSRDIRETMEDANEHGYTAYAICNTVLERNGDLALYSPEYEGVLVGLEEADGEDFLLLKDVVVMHEELIEDPKQVLKFTTLEQKPTMRIPLSQIGNALAANRRLGNDYVV